MKQQQSIGSSNQQQGLPANQHKQKIPTENKPVNKQNSQPEIPAVTNDSGSIVDKKHDDAGKGYSENKPTEPLRNAVPADEKPGNIAPNRQHAETEKVYGPKHNNINHRDQGFPEQAPREEKDLYEKRIRQAGNVEG